MAKNMSEAVISTGGKQYVVHEGDKIRIELLDAEAGSDVTFTDVLLLHHDGKTKVGTPTVQGASVTGKVLEVCRDDKIVVFKKKKRKGYKRTTGHRQHKLLIEVKSISAKPAAAPKKKAAAKTATVKKDKKTPARKPKAAAKKE